MKPKLLKISVAPENSFSCRFDSVPFFYNEWHFHPEVELVYIIQGSGTQFIGNDINHFNSDDMVYIVSTTKQYLSQRTNVHRCKYKR